MKQLYILRHADALPPGAPDYRDIDRALSEKGVQAITEVGTRLKKQGLSPALIVASPAVRTQSTAVILAEWLEYPRDAIVKIDSIYQASATELLAIISEFKDAYASVIVVGHNPGVSDVVNYFEKAVVVTLSPASFYGFAVKSEHWSDIFTAQIQQNYVDIP